MIRIEKRIWKTTLKNNKSDTVHLIVYDQIPVSNNGDITVATDELSGGELNEKTGEVSWEIELAPKAIIEKTIGYSVKYPKKSFLIVD